MTMPGGKTVRLYWPSFDNVEGLRVGDQAPSCFGGFGEVTEIYAHGMNRDGRKFVCYYVRTGSLTVSMSMVEDEICRTVPTSSHFKSAEVDRIEWQLKQARNEPIAINF